MTNPLRVTVWNENRHEQIHDEVKKIYPDGMHNVIARALRERGFVVGTATFDEPEHRLSEDVLNQTDVLIWRGHMLHNEVKDHVLDRLHKYVLNRTGLHVLHSGHESQILTRLM